MRLCTNGLETLAADCEVDNLQGAGWAARRVSQQRRYAVDARVREDGRIEARCFLCLLGVPEVREGFLARILA